MSQNTPQYIKNVPWYAMKNGQVGQSNRQNSSVKNPLQQWYQRGKKGFQATSFRKGACENCGGMGHQKKQCTERPRKVVAKFTNQNIAADDITKDLLLGWQGKRDRWNGYEPEMYKQVIEEFENFDDIRKRKKEDEGQDDVDAEYKIVVDPVECGKLQSKNMKTEKFHNLGGIRNREDRVKYLYNLSSNSDTFDPKSRSMKSYDNPAEALNNLEVMGEKYDLTEQDKFALQQVQKNNSELNSVGAPTLTYKIFNKVGKNSQNSKSGGKNEDLKQKYGNLDTNKPIQVIQQEEYVEYQERKEQKLKKSKYEEDVFINDHSAVWGSWYNKYFGWGYACCHSLQKNSFCLGKKGKEKTLALELKKKAEMLRAEKEIQEKNKDK